MGETIVITSAKDGVGKTVISTNIAAILAKWGYKTLLVDMNIGSRNSDMRLGVENEIVYDLADIIMGVCRIKKGIIQDKRMENLYFISSPQNQEKADFGDDAFRALIKELGKVFEYILIDAPAINSQNFPMAVSAGDKGIMVMVPEFGAIRDLEPVKTILKAAGIKNISILINKEFPELTAEGLTPTRDEIGELLGLSVLGTLDFNKDIHKWANRGLPMAGAVNLDEAEVKTVKKIETMVHQVISKVDDFAADTNI